MSDQPDFTLGTAAQLANAAGDPPDGGGHSDPEPPTVEVLAQFQVRPSDFMKPPLAEQLVEPDEKSRETVIVCTCHSVCTCVPVQVCACHAVCACNTVCTGHGLAAKPLPPTESEIREEDVERGRRIEEQKAAEREKRIAQEQAAEEARRRREEERKSKERDRPRSTGRGTGGYWAPCF